MPSRFETVIEILIFEIHLDIIFDESWNTSNQWISRVFLNRFREAGSEMTTVSQLLDLANQLRGLQMIVGDWNYRVKGTNFMSIFFLPFFTHLVSLMCHSKNLLIQLNYNYFIGFNYLSMIWQSHAQIIIYTEVPTLRLHSRCVNAQKSLGLLALKLNRIFSLFQL